jgi:hypothetical protein
MAFPLRVAGRNARPNLSSSTTVRNMPAAGRTSPTSDWPPLVRTKGPMLLTWLDHLHARVHRPLSTTPGTTPWLLRTYTPCGTRP